MNRKLLGIYLNDHLAGAVVGVELSRRMAGENTGTELGGYLANLAKEIEADRDAMMGVMDDLGIGKDPVKQAGAWMAEKAGRLKLNGQLRGYSPLSPVEELEALALAITGKLALWKSLRLLADQEPALDAAALDRLAERAMEQQVRVEERRLEAARGAFADGA